MFDWFCNSSRSTPGWVGGLQNRCVFFTMLLQLELLFVVVVGCCSLVLLDVFIVSCCYWLLLLVEIIVFICVNILPTLGEIGSSSFPPLFS